MALKLEKSVIVLAVGKGSSSEPDFLPLLRLVGYRNEILTILFANVFTLTELTKISLLYSQIAKQLKKKSLDWSNLIELFLTAL